VTRCLLFKVLITTNFITTNFIAANLIDTPNSTTMESIEEQWDPEPSSRVAINSIQSTNALSGMDMEISQQ
jgi:hypothetical protein